MNLSIQEFCLLSQASFGGILRAQLIYNSLRIYNDPKCDYNTMNAVVDELVEKGYLQRFKVAFFSITIEGKKAYFHDYQELKTLIDKTPPVLENIYYSE